MRFSRPQIAFFSFLVFSLFITSVFSLPVEGVTPVNDRDYVKAVHHLIQNAKTNIRVMLYQAWYYEEYPDSDSNVFLRELIAAKKRGVEVVVFMETSNWNQYLEEKNRDFARRLSEEDIPVYFDEKNITSHEKVMIIDDYATVVASNNWSHYSLWMNFEVGVIVWSRPVAGAFFDYLNKLMEEAGHDPLPESAAEKTISHGSFDLLPAEDVIPLTNREYFPVVHKAFQNAEESIRVAQRQASYYTMIPSYASDKTRKPGEPISYLNVFLKDLIEAQKRGIDVKVGLDAEVRKRRSAGEWTVSDDNEDFAMRLLAGNVPVQYDSLTTQTHAKMVIIDDKTIVGSTNWTYNAIHEGNEASVMITSEEVADYYRDYFEDIIVGPRVESGFDLWSLKREMEAREEKALKE